MIDVLTHTHYLPFIQPNQVVLSPIQVLLSLLGLVSRIISIDPFQALENAAFYLRNLYSNLIVGITLIIQSTLSRKLVFRFEVYLGYFAWSIT